MKNLLIACLFAACLSGCKSYSKYTIDDKPSIKIDTGLLGIWKAVADTDKADYVVFQNQDDIFSKHPEYMDSLEKKFGDRFYYVTRMNNHGQNPHYNQFRAFLSDLNNMRFLNITYHYVPWFDGNGEIGDPEIKGYFFVRIIYINPSYDSMKIAVVADTTLKDLTSSKEVRNRFEKNVSKPGFYSDTFIFYKVSGYHKSINESRVIANASYECADFGFKFVMKPIYTDTEIVSVKEKQPPYIHAVFFPVSVDGKHVYRDDETDKISESKKPTLPIEEQILKNVQRFFIKTTLPDCRLIIHLSHLVVDENGKVIFSNYDGIKGVTEDQSLRSAIAPDSTQVFDNVSVAPATCKGMKVISYRNLFFSGYSIEIKDHKFVYRRK